MNRWFHPEFETDLIDAARHYQSERPALGAAFLDVAEKAVEEIMRAPERWPVRLSGVRHFLVERFPYVIRYQISAGSDTVQFPASCTAPVTPTLAASAQQVCSLLNYKVSVRL